VNAVGRLIEMMGFQGGGHDRLQKHHRLGLHEAVSVGDVEGGDGREPVDLREREADTADVLPLHDQHRDRPQVAGEMNV